MLAILLYEQEDRRLRPLTDTTPLPLLPLQRVTLAERQLFWLSRQGITHAALTYIDREDRPPVRLPREVGGVRTVTVPCAAEDGYLGAILRTFEVLERDGLHPSGEILVIRGNVYSEADLRPFLGGRLRRRGRMGIMVSHTADPREDCLISYVHSGNERQIVTAVRNCPPLQQCCDDTIDAGIALLPAALLRRASANGDRAAWASLSFPALLLALLDAGEAPLAEEANGYFAVLRDLSAYYRCSMHLLKREDPNVGHDSSVIGRDCEIHSSASVRRSILMDGVKIGEGSAVEGAILCPGASVGAYAVVRPGCVIGAGSVLGNRVSLARDIRIPPADRIADDVTLLKSRSFSQNTIRLDDDASFSLASPDAILLVRLGAAAVQAIKGSDRSADKEDTPIRIGITIGEEEVCTIAAEALLCGIRAAGGIAVNCGIGFYSMAADHARRYHCHLMLTVEWREQLRISLLDRFGLMPNALICRRFQGALLHEPRFSVCGSLYPAELITDARDAYCQALAHCAGNLTGLRFRCDQTMPGQLLSRALEEAGATRCTGDARAPLSFAFDRAGTALSLTARDDSGPTMTADLWHIAALLLHEKAIPEGQPAALPYRAPERLNEIAAQAGIELLRYVHRPADDEEDTVRALAAQTPYLHDSVYAAARVCFLLVREKTNLRSLLALLPPFYCSTIHLDLPLRHRASLLHALGVPAEEGIRMREADGTVRVIPDIRQGFRIIADAVNAETAGELLSLSRQRIRTFAGAIERIDETGETEKT